MFLGAILIIIGAVITGTTITIMTKGSSWVVGFCWGSVCRLLPRLDPSMSSRHPIQPSAVLPRPTATPSGSLGRSCLAVPFEEVSTMAVTPPGNCQSGSSFSSRHSSVCFASIFQSHRGGSMSTTGELKPPTCSRSGMDKEIRSPPGSNCNCESMKST